MPRTHSFIKISATSGAAALMLAMATVTLTGCWEDPPPPPAPPPPPPAAPPEPEKPTVTPISQLMKELGISNKIRLPEEKAPGTDPERVAVLQFFDGFAKSNPEGVKAGLSQPDQAILALMEKDGSFKRSTETVSRVDLVTGSVAGKAYVWADFQSGEDHQWQLWQFTVEGEARKITSQSFDSYVQPENVASRIVIKGDRSEVIPEWIKLVAADMRLATEPDEILKPPQRVQKSDDVAAAADSSKSPLGAPKMRRDPPREPVKPPDFKPGGN